MHNNADDSSHENKMSLNDGSFASGIHLPAAHIPLLPPPPPFCLHFTPTIRDFHDEAHGHKRHFNTSSNQCI
jgi:hypothetical protein